jgi:hypothetical protein
MNQTRKRTHTHTSRIRWPTQPGGTFVMTVSLNVTKTNKHNITQKQTKHQIKPQYNTERNKKSKSLAKKAASKHLPGDQRSQVAQM